MEELLPEVDFPSFDIQDPVLLLSEGHIPFAWEKDLNQVARKDKTLALRSIKVGQLIMKKMQYLPELRFCDTDEDGLVMYYCWTEYGIDIALHNNGIILTDSKATPPSVIEYCLDDLETAVEQHLKLVDDRIADAMLQLYASSK